MSRSDNIAYHYQTIGLKALDAADKNPDLPNGQAHASCLCKLTQHFNLQVFKAQRVLIWELW
ncbi:hypothetical protein ACTXT7_002332 [Hymenolepis weldensis]